MNNQQPHQCQDFTKSVAAELDRLWEALRATDQRLLERLEYQRRQDELVAFQLDSVRDEIDDLAVWVTDRFDGRIDAAVGEAALARIEIDRVQERLGELVDQLNLRIAEVEAQVSSATSDVAAAVQTERLDELERAIDQLGVGVSADTSASHREPHALPAPCGEPTDQPESFCRSDDEVIDSMTRLLETMQPSMSRSSEGDAG